MVEHYLDTVGVTGSNPVSRTIFPFPNHGLQNRLKRTRVRFLPLGERLLRGIKYRERDGGQGHVAGGFGPRRPEQNGNAGVLGTKRHDLA